MDFIRQPATASSVAGLRSTKALPEAQSHLKKGHGHCLVVCCPSDPLQLSESQRNYYTLTSEKHAQQIDEMHQKLQCLQLAVVNRKGLIVLHNDTRPHVTQPMLQKLNELGYEVFPYLPYSPDLLATDYRFFKHLENFLQGKHFHNQQDAENAFQEIIES